MTSSKKWDKENFAELDSSISIVSPNLDTEDSNKDILSDEELKNLKILPLSSAVVFPGIILPVSIKDSRLIALAKKAHSKGETIGVLACRVQKSTFSSAEDFYQIGCFVKVLKAVVFPDKTTAIVLQGRGRFKVKTLELTGKNISAQVLPLEEKDNLMTPEEEYPLIESLRDVTKKIINYNTDSSSEMKGIIKEVKSLDFLTHFLAANLDFEIKKKQEILEIDTIKERANLLLECLLKSLDFAKIKKDIQAKVHNDITQHQKEQYIRYHIRALQEELGDTDEEDFEKLQKRAKSKKWPTYVQKTFDKVLAKARRTNPNSPDYSLNLDYAELLLDYPWQKVSKENLDIAHAETILEKDHFGLEKVKERIVEYLAVYNLNKELKGPIICLHGPPGVGKTSLGKSIAKALGREFATISLGGIADEAEIRGHRRTYIGAMPGKIVSTVKKLGTSNPLILLDEIDKISSLKGDPSAALLEVLDPEQNNAFMDHYMDIPVDLSKVMFLATANNIGEIAVPLRDRLEIIDLSGYIIEEKLEIAKRYIIPAQKKENGLKPTDFFIEDDALLKIIDSYTSEAGVRELKRKIAAVCRKVAVYRSLDKAYDKKITRDQINSFLGLETVDKDLYQKITIPGVAIGLAWTAVGGDILFIEASLSKGKGNVNLSGQIGDVMKESANTALSYLKAKAEKYNIDSECFSNYDLHVHFPAGSVPKDGPSAGITILSALTSVYTKRKVKSNLAMSGEATLRGTVLPVGGIKEKILAAKRVGIQNIILCSQNRKDVEDIPAKYTEGLTIQYINDMDEVLDLVLE